MNKQVTQKVLVLAVIALIGVPSANAADIQINLANGLRFNPWASTVHIGDTVTFLNDSHEEHIVKSIDPFNTAGPKNISNFLAGKKAGAAHGDSFSIKFDTPGLFPYFCSIHAKLNRFKQPLPAGAMKGAPMMGVIAVIP